MDAIEPVLSFGLEQRFEALPSEVVQRVKLGLLDTLAATVAGSRDESLGKLTGLVGAWGGAEEARILATGRKLPVPLAVMVNGTAGRAWDLDDVHEQNTCHISVNILAPALALAEARGPVDGASFLTAFAVGSEAVCRLSSAPRISFSDTGMCLSYQCGSLAAALTAARLLRFTPAQARNALGIAYARLAGNQQAFIEGAMTVRLMQGMAAESGVIAALMAECGLTGSHNILEGKFGYYPSFHRGQYERDDVVGGLGTDWQYLQTSIKPIYPCCKFVHGPIEATLDAIKELGHAADDVERIDVTVTNKEVYDLVCRGDRKWNPNTAVDAQFSLPFIVAYAVVHGCVGFQTFQRDALDDGAVRRTMEKVHVQLDVAGQGSSRGAFPMPGVVEVSLKSGQRSKRTKRHISGHPQLPMTISDVEKKYEACARFAGHQASQIEEVIDFVRGLERVEDTGRLARLASGS